jgi:hypothetical protein
MSSRRTQGQIVQDKTPDLIAHFHPPLPTDSFLFLPEAKTEKKKKKKNSESANI